MTGLYDWALRVGSMTGLYDWTLCRYQYVAAYSMQRRRALLRTQRFRGKYPTSLNPSVVIQVLLDAPHIKS